MKRETILITVAAMLAFGLIAPLRDAADVEHSTAEWEPKLKKGRRRRKRHNTLSGSAGLKSDFQTLSHSE